MFVVTWQQVFAWRMKRQSLVPRTSASVADIVRRCAGIQAQLHSAAVLAVAQRRRAPRPGEVDAALWRERSIVKTWAMRGTLHLIAADQLPNVVAVMRTLHPWTAPSWERYHGVKAAEVERAREAIAEVLADGRALTREELGAEVADRVRSRRVTERLGSGWGELLKPAAYAGRLIQGPPRDGRVTYTRPDSWLGSWSEPDPISGGAALARSYLRAHGPARREDVASWWARQPASKVKTWFDAISDELVEVDVEGRASWMLASDLDALHRQEPNTEVRLLPAFDQYVLAAARDVEALVPAGRRPDVFRTAGWVSPVVVRGGTVVGTWSTADGDIAIDGWMRLPRDAVRREIDRLRSAGASIRSDPDP